MYAYESNAYKVQEKKEGKQITTATLIDSNENLSKEKLIESARESTKIHSIHSRANLI